ncbi:MAG: sensor histidine kinase [Flammeovirgaceae bacterium]
MKRENHLLDRFLQNRVLTHTSFWLFALLIAPITSSESITEIGEALLFRGVALPTKIAGAYFVVYYIIPQLFQKKKYIQSILVFIAGTYILTVIYRFNNIHIAEVLAGVDQPRESLWQIITEFEFTFWGYVGKLHLFTFLFLFLKMIKDQATEKHQLEALQKEKVSAELNFLKAQIHPHFLFNTLNNLYALTLEKSDEAPDVVAKLSEMLDYMLYQCREDSVLLNREVELLEHYIDLEKLRYGNRLELTFEHTIDNPQAVIAPLILISVVENAFKHGVSDSVQPAIIRMRLVVENNVLKFRVFNTKATFSQPDQMGYKEGIGVKNVTRQLELIYPNQYEWVVNEDENTYEVELSIQL